MLIMFTRDFIEASNVNLGIDQTDFIKSTPGTLQQTPTLRKNGDTGISPLLDRQKCNRPTIKYWESFVSLWRSPRKNPYHMLQRLHNLRFKNWCSHTYYLLEETDLLDVWNASLLIATNIWCLQISHSIRNPKLSTNITYITPNFASSLLTLQRKSWLLLLQL